MNIRFKAFLRTFAALAALAICTFGTSAAQTADQLLYVCNQNGASISVVDMEHNVVIHTIDLQELGFSANARPHHIAVEPDGSFWYVSLIGENRVLKFNRNNEIVGQASFEVPGMLALDPASNLLYVGRSMSAVNPPQRIGVINREDMTVEEIDVFFPRPHALAVDPKTGLAYSGSMTVDQIAVVDGKTLDVELITVEAPASSSGSAAVDHSAMDHSNHGNMGQPAMAADHGNMFVQFAIAPDSPTMVVGGEMTGQVLFFDLSSPLAPELKGTVAVNAKPWDPVFTPDGRYIYLGNNGANTVTVLDAKERTVEAVITGNGLSEPYGSAIRPDGRYVYISNSNLAGDYKPRTQTASPSDIGTLVVIDTQTQQIVKVLEVGEGPTGIGTRRSY
jgi:YVTN family beta-propeller protein